MICNAYFISGHVLPNMEHYANKDPVPTNESTILTNDIGVQTDMSMLHVKKFKTQFMKLKQKIQSLKKENNDKVDYIQHMYRKYLQTNINCSKKIAKINKRHRHY